MSAQAVAQGLIRESAFRRFLIASVALHVSVVGYVAWNPQFAAAQRLPVVVMIDPTLPNPVPEAPPAPKPEPPKPPEPEPPPPPEKPAPPQEVEEAVVIPPVPRERPRERPKPEPPKPQPPKPEPPKPRTPPPPPPPSAEDLIKAMRDRVGETAPKPAQGSPGAGVLDPELAAYQAQIQSCFYSKWIGIQRYKRRRDLRVEFEVRVTPDGTVVSVDKVRDSGEPFLDETAERAIQRCSPLPPPPANRLQLRITFSPGDVT